MSTWRKRALQTRSLKTEHSLAHAARDLMSDKSYPDISVAEVAEQAGVSIGGFYARFKSKKALLHLADLEFLNSARHAFDVAVPENMEGSLREIVRAFIHVMVHEFERHRGAILASMRYVSEEDESDFRSRADEFNDHVHGRMRRLLTNRASDIRHSQPDLAINMAIFFASAAAREAVLRNALHAYPVRVDLPGLVDELARSAEMYLRGSRA